MSDAFELEGPASSVGRSVDQSLRFGGGRRRAASRRI
jgi:hypothetical protein